MNYDTDNGEVGEKERQSASVQEQVKSQIIIVK